MKALPLLLLPFLLGASPVDELVALWDGEGSGCATDVVARANAAFPTLSDADKHAVALRTWPAYQARIAAGEPGFLDGGLRDTCFDPVDVDGFASHEQVLESERFRFYVRSGAQVSGEATQRLAALYEDTLDDYLAAGWRAPAGLETGLQMPVFLEDLAADLGAYTWVNPCASTPEGYADYIVIGTSWLAEPELWEPAVPHELFHTLQRRYAPSLVQDGVPQDVRWFLEASATYQERLMLPERTALARARASSWSTAPWLPLTSRQDTREYESFVFLVSAEAVAGGPAWHQRLWEEWEERPVLDAIDAALAADGSSLAEAFADHVRRAAEMDLPGYGADIDTPRDVEGLAARYDSTELPAKDELDADAPKAPGALGVSYVWIGTRGSLDRSLRVDLDGSFEDGPDPEWLAVLAPARQGELLEPPTLELEDSGRARGKVHGIDEGIDGVWLMMAPRSQAVETAGWSWSAKLVSGPDGLATEQVPVGCSAGGLRGGWLSLGLLLLVATRLRRRHGQ